MSEHLNADDLRRVVANTPLSDRVVLEFQDGQRRWFSNCYGAWLWSKHLYLSAEYASGSTTLSVQTFSDILDELANELGPLPVYLCGLDWDQHPQPWVGHCREANGAGWVIVFSAMEGRQ